MTSLDNSTEDKSIHIEDNKSHEGIDRSNSQQSITGLTQNDGESQRDQDSIVLFMETIFVYHNYC